MKQKKKSEMEDISVEITGAEENKRKRMGEKKSKEPSQRSLEQCKVHGHSEIQSSRRIERQSV